MLLIKTDISNCTGWFIADRRLRSKFIRVFGLALPKFILNKKKFLLIKITCHTGNHKRPEQIVKILMNQADKIVVKRKSLYE